VVEFQLFPLSSKSPMNQARARHFRAFARRPSELSAAIAFNGREIKGRLVDLGLGGAGLLLPEALPGGERVHLVLHLPQLWDPLEILTEIAWCEAQTGDLNVRAGVRFVAPSGRCLRLLAEALTGVSS
jgi:hypothetical protein